MLTEKNTHRPIKLGLGGLIKKTEYELRYLKTYLSSNTNSLSDRESDLIAKMLADIEKDPDDESFIQELYEKEIGKISSYFYHSSIVLLYSFLESTLCNLCLTIQSETGSPLSHSNIAGNNIVKRSKQYLEFTTGIDFEKVNDQWERITQFQKLRNSIVHENSEFSGSDDSIESKKQKLTSMFSEIEVLDDEFYLRDSSLPLEFLKLIDDFTRFVYLQIESKSFLVKDESISTPDIEELIPF